MAQRIELFLTSDMVIEVSNLRNTVTDALVTGATVTADVLDSDGNDVTGAGNPISFSEVAGYNGLYRGSIPDTASLSLGDVGTLVVTADAGAGLLRTWTIEYKVVGVQ